MYAPFGLELNSIPGGTMSRPNTELRGNASQRTAAIVTWSENQQRKLETDQTPNKIPKHLTRNVPKVSGRFDTYAYVHAMRGLHTFATLPLSLRLKRHSRFMATMQTEQTIKSQAELMGQGHLWPTNRQDNPNRSTLTAHDTNLKRTSVKK